MQPYSPRRFASSQSASISASVASLIVLSLEAEHGFDEGKAPFELGIGAAQRCFRIRLGVTGEIGCREQKIADFSAERVHVAARVELGLDFVRLFADLGENSPDVVPVEADNAGLLLQLHGARQGRHRGGYVGQQPIPGDGGRVMAAACRPRGLFLRLDRRPEHLDLLRREGARVAEYVRVSADELGRDRLDDVRQGEQARFLGQAGMIDDLEQEVAELVLEIAHVVPLDGVGHLVGLLDRERDDGPEALLEIPRAAGHRRAQRRHDLDQALDVAARRQRPAAGFRRGVGIIVHALPPAGMSSPSRAWREPAFMMPRNWRVGAACC